MNTYHMDKQVMWSNFSLQEKQDLAVPLHATSSEFDVQTLFGQDFMT